MNAKYDLTDVYIRPSNSKLFFISAKGGILSGAGNPSCSNIIGRCRTVLLSCLYGAIFSIVSLCLLAMMEGCTQNLLGRDDMTQPAAIFRQIRWGCRLEDAKGLSILKNGENIAAAYNPNESPEFGMASIEKVTYYFEENVFTKAEIDYNGLDNFALIKKEMTRRYGPPAHSDKKINVYIWSMKEQRLAATLRYYKTGRGTLYFTHFLRQS